MQRKLYKVKFQGEENLVKAVECKLCDYKCEKSAYLKKHINFKHTVQKCKVCRKEFKSSLEMVSHVPEEHHEDDEAF